MFIKGEIVFFPGFKVFCRISHKYTSGDYNIELPSGEGMTVRSDELRKAIIMLGSVVRKDGDPSMYLVVGSDYDEEFLIKNDSGKKICEDGKNLHLIEFEYHRYKTARESMTYPKAVNRMYLDTEKEGDERFVVAPLAAPLAVPDDDKTRGKDDFKDDKLRWDLLPMQEIEDIVRVFHLGAKKYEPNGWKDIPNGFERYRAAMMRHLMCYMNGERYDKELGVNHLSSMCWNAIAMLWYDKHGKGLLDVSKDNDEQGSPKK